MSAQVTTTFNLTLVKCSPFDVVAKGTTLFINTENGVSFSIELDSVESMKKLGDTINEAVNKLKKNQKNQKKPKAVKKVKAVESDSDSSSGCADEDEEDDLIGAISKFNIEDAHPCDADEVVDTQQLF